MLQISLWIPFLFMWDVCFPALVRQPAEMGRRTIRGGGDGAHFILEGVEARLQGFQRVGFVQNKNCAGKI